MIYIKRKFALTVLVLYLASVITGCGFGRTPDPLEHNMDGGVELEDEQNKDPVPTRGG